MVRKLGGNRGKERQAHKRGIGKTIRAKKRVGTSVVRQQDTMGFVVMSDIVGFSVLPYPDQVRSVVNLSKWLEEETVGACKSGKEPYINCTGDGFILAIEEDALKGKDAAEWCLCLCESLLKKCKAASLRVRMAVHRGHFIPRIRSFNATHAIGNALNDAARLIGVPDAFQIAASREFRDFLADRTFGLKYSEQEQEFDRFSPAGRGYTVQVKHDKPAMIYWYNGSDHSTEVLNRDLPHRVAFIEGVGERIRSRLRAICELVANGLGDRETLKPRVSVFWPTSSGSHLQVGKYRCRLDLPEEAIAASQTTYKVRPKEEAQGPVGIAFARNKAVIVVGLPRKDPKDPTWEERWKTSMLGITSIDGEPMNLSRAELTTRGKWIRKAQSFVSVPIRLLDSEPLAALCVDMREPLDERKDRLRELARELIEASTNNLAPLLMLRRS